MNSVAAELPWLWAGLTCYAMSSIAALRALNARRGEAPALLPWLLLGLCLIGGAIVQRWLRIGHGPFLNMFEILISNLFSLGLVFAIAYWRSPSVRPSAIVVLPVLLVLALWTLLVTPVDTHLPPTYETPILWLHVAAGKLFLGLLLVAVGLGGFICLRRTRVGRGWPALPVDSVLDQLAWRFTLAALAFQSLMLIAGAWWAQGAWGRYWAWDPLETWAFVTWLAAAVAVHVRSAYRITPRFGAALIFAIFALAFLTFFGVPFLSVAPHKGAV